jgi:hypothetical protein
LERIQLHHLVQVEMEVIVFFLALPLQAEEAAVQTMLQDAQVDQAVALAFIPM